jgi:hypothetical protein
LSFETPLKFGEGFMCREIDPSIPVSGRLGDYTTGNTIQGAAEVMNGVAENWRNRFGRVGNFQLKKIRSSFLVEPEVGFKCGDILIYDGPQILHVVTRSLKLVESIDEPLKVVLHG